MKLTVALFLFLFVSLTFAASFGYSRLVIERTWNITGGGAFEFTGSLVCNDSNQRVISIIIEPNMTYQQDENGTIVFHYSGNHSTVLKAKAIVDTNYDTNIMADRPLNGTSLNSTPLTEADAAIAAEARMLAIDNSSLRTIRNLANWVHDNIEYDINYWGKEKSAREVFIERRGVCVEYSHLLISMARSLGFETRYVSGYVLADTWQPHAWVEIYVPDYGWLPVDATFGQVGVLDSTHLAIRKGDDQSGSYDVLLSEDENISISAWDRLDTEFTSEDAKGVSLTLDIDKEMYVAETVLTNHRSDYVFGSYSLIMPAGFGGEKTSVVLLGPGETLSFYHGLNRSLFQRGYFYKIPISASFNDAKDEATLIVNESGTVGESNKEGAGAQTCVLAFALCLGGIFSFIQPRFRT